MVKRRIRLILAILILTASLFLLIWGLWPLAHLTQILSLQAGSLVVP